MLENATGDRQRLAARTRPGTKPAIDASMPVQGQQIERLAALVGEQLSSPVHRFDPGEPNSTDRRTLQSPKYIAAEGVSVTVAMLRARNIELGRPEHGDR